MTSAAPSRGPAGGVPRRASWPGRAGPGGVGGGVGGGWVTEGGGGPGAGPGPAGGDWGRASGKTQLAAAFAESLWRSGQLDLLVWIQATSRAAVLSGYAAATAAVTG